MNTDMGEAYLRAEIVSEIAAAIPNEVVTEWEAGFTRGLRKAIQIVEAKS